MPRNVPPHISTNNHVVTSLPPPLPAPLDSLKAKPLLNVRYEERFEMDLGELRRELNITPVPTVPPPAR